eukprot:COSAG02_NODE_26147_length_639_cov_2.535185_1_plen_79_part_10
MYEYYTGSVPVSLLGSAAEASISRGTAAAQPYIHTPLHAPPAQQAGLPPEQCRHELTNGGGREGVHCERGVCVRAMMSG